METPVEIALIRSAQDGDESAMEKLLQEHRRRILAVVRKPASYGILDAEDLFQIGAVAFLTAVQDWEPPLRLWQRAKRPVAHASSRALASAIGSSETHLRRFHHAVRVSNGDREAAKAWATSTDRPSRERMSEVAFDAIEDALRDTTPEHDVTLPDAASERVSDDTAAMMEAVSAAAHVLTDRERKVLEMHYGLDGEPMTDGAIAARFGIDRSRIVRVRNRAIDRLREEIAAQGLTLKS